LHSILIVQKKNKVVNAPCFALALAWCGVVQTSTISRQGSSFGNSSDRTNGSRVIQSLVTAHFELMMPLVSYFFKENQIRLLTSSFKKLKKKKKKNRAQFPSYPAWLNCGCRLQLEQF